jgi:hypothetical protein
VNSGLKHKKMRGSEGSKNGDKKTVIVKLKILKKKGGN